MPIDHLKARPVRRDAWLDAKRVAFPTEAENGFERDAVKPTRRACVPRPAAPPGVWRSAIHIGADHVRLDFVTVHVVSCRRVVDRIDHVPKAQSKVSTAL